MSTTEERLEHIENHIQFIVKDINTHNEFLGLRYLIAIILIFTRYYQLGYLFFIIQFLF